MIEHSVPGYFHADWPAPDNVEALVTTRIGGFSQSPHASFNLAMHVGDDPAVVTQNRNLLARILPQPLQWQWLEQIHSNKVLRINRLETNVVADGLITSTPGIACCVLTADCLSIFFVSLDGSEVAVTHAGWRGMAAGIIANTVLAMSTPAPQLLVWLGPAIGPCHFEVGAEVRAAFIENWQTTIAIPEIAACFARVDASHKFMADLFALARLQLSALGVSEVYGGGDCTYCQPDKYYSFRRGQDSGRLLSMIYLKTAR